MAAEESLSRLDSQVSMDASPPEINSLVQESGQTSVAGGKDVHAEIDTEESKSSFYSGTRHMELEKYKYFMPSNIRIDYFDVLVLYSEDNKSEARTFCDHLKNDIKLKHNEFVKAVLYDECVPHAGSIFKLLETALERCTHVFCYITKEFCEDKWTELSKDECLMEAITNEEKQWCVVPVITVPTKTAKFKIPIGLRALTNIHYYQNDQYYRHKVSTLIQNNLHRRLENERKQKEQQFNWIKKNKGALHFGNEDIRCQENKEKLGTKQQKKEKITEEGVNDGLIQSRPVSLQKAGDQTGTDPHTQPTGTSFKRRSVDKLRCRGRFGESVSEGNDSTCINSIKSTDQLSQGGSMPLHDSPNSAMVSSSINSCTEENMPIQEDSCTGATSDECLQDIGLLSLNPDVDLMHSKSDDQSQETQMTPVNQSPSCWGTEVTVEEEEERNLETNSKDESISVKKTKMEEEQSLETKSKGHSMSVKTKEEEEHYSSLSKKEFAGEMKDQDVHFWHKAKGSNEKPVAIVTPRPKVCKDRDGEKTDLDIVDRETNGDTEMQTTHETRETTLYEMEQTLPNNVGVVISGISPFRERPFTDLSRYVAMRPAATLLANASPIRPVILSAVTRTCVVQSYPTSAQCTKSSKGTLSQDELD